MKVCIRCGKPKEPYQKLYCKKCGKKREKERNKINLRKVYRRNRQKLLKKLNNKCTFCETKKDLHVHHIIPLIETKQGNNRRQPQYMYNDCAMLLCHKCHIIWHDLKIDFQQVVM